MKSLTLFERNILEIIADKNHSFSEIQKASGIIPQLCLRILHDLLEKKMIQTNGVQFFISPELSSNDIRAINSEENIQHESIEYIETIMENKESNLFKFKKIKMADDDFKILKAMMFNIESFIKETQNKKSKSITDQKVIFWGMGDLKNITQQILMETV